MPHPRTVAVTPIFTAVPLPTFVFIGPGRSGSTWMYELLRSHPDVCLGRGTKETLFFEKHYDRGVDWYESFFF